MQSLGPKTTTKKKQRNPLKKPTEWEVTVPEQVLWPRSFINIHLQ